MFVILGVSGHTGSVAARSLLERKKPVRVVVRDAAKGVEWSARGAEVAIGDVENEASLAKAFSGAEGAYVLLPPDLTAAEPIARGQRIADKIVKAAVEAKLPHLVL